MDVARPLIEDLAVVLCVAAATSVLSRRLRQPVVLGYLLAGLIVGPHTPFPLFADEGRIHTLSELGVILVMFCIGLEFSVRRLARLVPSAGIICLIQVSTMLWLGYLAGQALGWSVVASVFTGATLAISSTMVVVKVFDDQHVGGKLAERVYGVLIMQDIAAVLLLAGLTAVGTGRGLSAEVLLPTVARLVVFLVVLVAAGFLIVPRIVRTLARKHVPEMLLVSSMGICFAFALAAHKLGYSVALGAFIAGSLVAESGEPARVLRLVTPLRDVFGAVFFVSIGMSVDPHIIGAHAGTVLLLTLLVVAGQALSVSVGSFLSGYDIRSSVQTGMSLAQIGEFSFLIAALGVSTGSVGPELLPITVAVATLTAFLTPFMVRASEATALAVDRRLPRRIQTFATLYGSWLEALREPARRGAVWAQCRRLVLLIVLDAAIVAGIVVATSLGSARIAEQLDRLDIIGPRLAYWLVPLAAAVAALPFLIGIVRCVRGLGALLAQAALPAARQGRVDFADAPRRALVVMVQLLLLLAVLVPLLAVTQPFVPLLSGAPVLVGLLLVTGVVFWRRATNLQEHVVAGAQMVVEALMPRAGAARASGAAARAADEPDAQPDALMEQVEQALPGIGSLQRLHLAPDAAAVGRSLRDLNLRGRTGATVLAIVRDGRQLIAPDGHETLRANDDLALTGTHEALAAAAALLEAHPQRGDAGH